MEQGGVLLRDVNCWHGGCPCALDEPDRVLTSCQFLSKICMFQQHPEERNYRPMRIISEDLYMMLSAELQPTCEYLWKPNSVKVSIPSLPQLDENENENEDGVVTGIPTFDEEAAGDGLGCQQGEGRTRSAPGLLLGSPGLVESPRPIEEATKPVIPEPAD